MINNIEVPNVFECTYIRKKVGETLAYNTDPIPSPLDQPNLVNVEEIKLTGPPFIDSVKL